MKSLALRLLSATVLIVVFFALLALGRAGILALVVLLVGLSLWEFGRLSALLGTRAPRWLLLPLGYYFALSGTQLRGIPLQLVLALIIVLGLTPFIFLPGRRQGLSRWAMSLAGAIYIGVPFNYYLLLYTSSPRGLSWLVVLIATVAIADAGALFIGMRVGRHLLLPSISPKKTWEGAIGGILVALPVMIIGGSLWLRLPWLDALILGILVGISGAIGDLVESQMKRLAKVKDSSDLIPGHGGVLDRIDSHLFPPIVTYMYASLFHLL